MVSTDRLVPPPARAGDFTPDSHLNLATRGAQALVGDGQLAAHVGEWRARRCREGSPPLRATPTTLDAQRGLLQEAIAAAR
jgi:hypothetical protein